MIRVIFLIATFISSPYAAKAFVQNVSHGYPSCIACHVSPSGGGLLTDYGRSLSEELMSSWRIGGNFSQPVFGLLKNKKNVKFGGDIRSIQTYFKNKDTNRGRLFPMQQNLEVGVNIHNVMLVGTAGLQQGPEGAPRRGQFISERHYGIWSTSPTTKIRVGKFRQSFGINTPNHRRLIKNLFGFGSLSETYNLELTQFYETYEVTIGASLGRLDIPQSSSSENNASAHYSYYLNGNSRLGASLLIGESDLKRRTLFGLNSILPLAKEWLLLSEVDFEQAQFSIDPTQNVGTLASLIQLGNTSLKGLMVYFVFEHASIDRGTSYTSTVQPGLGLQWLPIPHFNVQIEYLRQVNSGAPGKHNQIGFISLHTYL